MNIILFMPISLLVLIIVMDTLMATIDITTYCYCKYKSTKDIPKTFSVTYDRSYMKNNKDIKAMFSSSSQKPSAPPKVKSTLKKGK